MDKLRLKNVSKYMSDIDIYAYLFGENFYLYPWKYKSFAFKTIKLNNDLAVKIFNNYLTENGIQIDDPLTFDYQSIINKCGLQTYCNGKLLEFAVRVNEFKYPGYKFKITTGIYLKEEANLLFDLEYLIVEDLKIDSSKIPLYITKQVLATKARPLYNYIVTNKNHSIYYWIDKLYPGKFIAADFEINPYRLSFDSDSELFIDEVLREYFKNVQYNQRNHDGTITINGMNPDWLIFTDKGVILVEYFGMYEEGQTRNSRIESYKIKTKRKIENYQNDVRGYEYLFLFKSDIVNDFSGARDKIEKLIKKLGASRV